MRLFAIELKKIWHPVVAAAVLVLGIMYFALMPSFYVTYFPNGPNQQAVFDFATGWAERFGLRWNPRSVPRSTCSSPTSRTRLTC